MGPRRPPRPRPRLRSDRIPSPDDHRQELYFYRWRPQNEIYLFGFRKHEQGNNAGSEIPLFDPLSSRRRKGNRPAPQAGRTHLRPVKAGGQVEHSPISFPSPCAGLLRLWTLARPLPSRVSFNDSPPPTLTPKSAAGVVLVADGFEVNLFAADLDPRQADRDQFRLPGPPLGLARRSTSSDRPSHEGQRQGADPRRHQRRRQVGQDERLRRRPADPDRDRAGRRRGVRRQQHRAAPPERHQWRRQGRPSPRRKSSPVSAPKIPPHPRHLRGFDGQLYFNQSIYIH